MSALGRIAIWMSGVALLTWSSPASAEAPSAPAETSSPTDTPPSTAWPSNDEVSTSPPLRLSPVPQSPSPDALRSNEVRDVRSEIPNYAYAYTAYGATAKTLGVQAYGLGLTAAGQKGIVGGGPHGLGLADRSCHAHW